MGTLITSAVGEPVFSLRSLRPASRPPLISSWRCLSYWQGDTREALEPPTLLRLLRVRMGAWKWETVRLRSD